jgi:hypothetical protein
MADVYYYVKKEDIETTLLYGLKLSENTCGEILINNINKNYMLGLLNPKDNIYSFNSDEFSCIRANIDNNYLYVTDLTFIGTDYFFQNIIPADEYILGKFRSPIFIILCTILPNQISTINKNIDVPVLYNNSLDLYLENNIEYLKEFVENPNEVILKSLLEHLTDINILIKTDLKNNKNAYIDISDSKNIYTY